MTIAEIYGKISSSGSNLSTRLEDLLTSDVFGPLRYLPFTKGILCVLGEARLYSDSEKKLWEKLKGSFPDGTSDSKVYFWPRTGDSEPDVLVKCSSHLLMIESKYLSGETGNYDGENHQLAKEFLDLVRYKGEFTKRSLIYLTADRILPKDYIGSGHRHVCERHKDDYQESTYWLSWFDVHKTVSKLLSTEEDRYRKLILKDIKELLYKKGLRGFEGFGKIEKVDSVPDSFFYQ